MDVADPEIDAAACMARIVAYRDRDAFKALFLAYGPRLKTFLIRHGASAAQAEELAQEAMLTLWRKSDQYDAERASVPAWLFTIARNLRLDVLRKERSALAYELAAPSTAEPAAASPEDEHDLAERQARVHEAVQNLPLDQLEVVRLSFFNDMPHAQIAEHLALPLGTVKSRLRLAAGRLRAALGDLA